MLAFFPKVLCVYFPVLLCLSVSVKSLAVKTASEMTYTVSGGALNSKVLKIQHLKALKINVFDYPNIVYASLWNPANIRINLILPKSRVIGLHLRR